MADAKEAEKGKGTERRSQTHAWAGTRFARSTGSNLMSTIKPNETSNYRGIEIPIGVLGSVRVLRVPAQMVRLYS